MIKRALLLALSLACSCAGIAQAQPQLRLEGVSDEGLRSALLRVLGDRSFEADQMQRDLRSARERADQFLRSEGYYDARIDTRVSAQGDPVLRVSPGRRFTAASINYTYRPERDDTPPQLVQSALAEGDPLRTRSVLDAEAEGLAWLRDHGWPDAQIGTRRVVVDHATQEAEVSFGYETGPYSTFGGFESMPPGWRADYLDQFVEFEQGEAISASDMRRLQRRLSALDSVSSASLGLSPAYPGTSARTIEASFVPAPRHAVEAGMVISTTDGAGIAGRWSRRNLRGGDETLSITAELATLRGGLDAQIVLPHWRQPDQRLLLDIGYQQENTDAYEQDEIGAEIRLFRRLSDITEIGASLRSDISSIEDITGRRDLMTTTADASIVRDRRDDVLNPSSGWLIQAAGGGAVVVGDTEATYTGWAVSGRRYAALGERFVLAGRLTLGGIAGASVVDVPADKRFYAGGGGSVRGFDYQSLSPRDENGNIIGGRSLTEISAELRWRNSGNWGAVAFIDAGGAFTRETPSFEDLDYAIGVGARYFLGFAPVRVDVAVPLSGDDYNPQLYISFGQAF